MSLLSRLAVAASKGYGLLAGASTNVSADYLVVAGGGAGGGGWTGGGGGAGGLLTSVTTLSTLFTYYITVGAGGSGSGANGSNSSLSGTQLTTITAFGGGGGITDNSGLNGNNGGSGGGGGYNSGAGGTGVVGQGNNGGTGSGWDGGAQTVTGGGGGGAGAAGSNGVFSNAGDGGIGVQSSISGTATYYAGGGGGGGAAGASNSSPGGLGGGGAGGVGANVGGTAGTANTGGGGGGFGKFSGTGASGGSGIVIIAYTAASPKFVGGTITTSGGKQIHTFTSSGTLSPITPITASYLVVAGGGSGGTVHAGGGGAGGLLASSTTLYSGATYIVTVGAGGASQTSGDSNGFAGSNSVLSGTGLTTITATGGGLGGNSFPGSNGGTGGSGGGGGRAGTGGAGTSGQGNTGGNGGGSGTTGGGGGGGAGAVGSNGGAQDGGAGGAGSASSITGTSTTYAGGGGGGIYTSNTGSPGVGGLGGGGAGGKGATTLYGTPGTQNTGGGGGGGGDRSGAGGSGIVIISYAGSQAFNGGLVTSSGGNTIHTFTSSGVLTPLTTNLNNSLRFRGSNSAYLSRTPTIAGNRKTWTWSAWIKIGTISVNMGTLFIAQGQTAIYLNDGTYSSFRVNGAAGSDLITSMMPRDPSAWYHLVVACDTTQAVEANRLKIYVNGVQQTAFQAGSAYPTLNGDTYVNSTAAHYIGRRVWNSDQQYDGYMTDVYLIDGQALEPYYFGNNDANGVWKPIQYKGMYGTNGFYLPFTTNSTTAYAGYSTDVSSIFNTLPTGSQGSNFTFTGDFTIEGWVLFPAANGDQSFYVNSDGTNYLALNIDVSSGVYNIYCNSNSPTSSFSSGITVGNWTHIAMVRSGSIITLYTNGVPRGTIGNSSTLGFSSLTLNRFGGGGLGARYISNVRITKSAVYTSKFVPPTSALTNITNTVVLTYQNSSAIDNSSNAYTIGTTGAMSYPGGSVIWNANVISDASGNANNWTPNNLNYSFYNTTYDAMTDVPTNTSATVANYCVLNPLNKSTNVTVSNANLTSTSAVTNAGISGTMYIPSTGKYYWEATCTTRTNYPIVGIANAAWNLTYPGATSGSFGYANDGLKYNNGSTASYGASYTSGDIIGVAFDADAGTLTFYKNNASQGTAYTGLTDSYTPAISGQASDVWNMNFGQRSFAYTPPTGFVALNTFNLPTPTILQGNKYMDATLWTGTGSSQVIVNQGQFRPDFVWIKNRSAGYGNILFDAIRGATNWLSSNDTSAEATTSSSLTSFNSNGFSIGDWVVQSNNGNSVVGWQWQAGSSTVTNTSGSISSQVRANTTAGFSVVTYTGTGVAATIGHGLGVAPKFYIVKRRNASGDYWCCYHTSIGATKGIYLNTTDAAGTSDLWNNTEPTSTVFSVKTTTGVNASGGTYVAYCWAEIAGFSKFGSYTGNGSADGPFVYTGFRPKFIMLKRTDTTGNWSMYDATRNTYNAGSYPLYPNLSNVEDASTDHFDWLSNGFKMKSTNQNASGGTFIYVAFAEHPFKNANAR